jgi:hypothetical protein
MRRFAKLSLLAGAVASLVGAYRVALHERDVKA